MSELVSKRFWEEDDDLPLVAVANGKLDPVRDRDVYRRSVRDVLFHIHTQKCDWWLRPKPIIHRIGIPCVSMLLCPRFHLGSSYAPVLVSSDELRAITDNFSKNNLIGDTQCGGLYRGKIVEKWGLPQTRPVTVKIFDFKITYPGYIGTYKSVDEEKLFLTHPNVREHPNLLKLIGFCKAFDIQGTMYDFEVLDTVHNLVPKESFTWVQRIKVALGLARVLEFLHCGEKPYVVGNVSGAHVVVDKNYHPKLLDLCMLSGGILGEGDDSKKMISFYYAFAHELVDEKKLADIDVISYGALLLELISKSVGEMLGLFAVMRMQEWVTDVYRPNQSLVHESFLEDPDFHDADGVATTELALRCLDLKNVGRPSMTDVVKSLEGLHVCKLLGNGGGL